MLGYSVIAQTSPVYTYEGKKFRPGDQIMIQIRAGTFKPADTGHANRIEGSKGKKGELIRVDHDVATIKWNAQTWDERGTKKQIKLPSFVSTMHLGYIKVLSSKKLSKAKLAEYENYEKYSDEEAKKVIKAAEDLIAKYGDRYIYRGPEEEKEVTPTNSEKVKTDVAVVEEVKEKEIAPPPPPPVVEEIPAPPEPEVQEVKTEESKLIANAPILIGSLVGILITFLLIRLSKSSFKS